MLNPFKHSPVGVVMFISGAAGFLLGCFEHGTWQLAVESAQVVAGLVNYSRDNPFYMHHVKLWSLLHQVCVPLLLLGISERILSFIFSGFIAMFYFQALSLCVWALCRNIPLAFACPFFVAFTHSTRFCAIYPVVLMGTSNTHGAIGLSLVLLALALMASDKYKHAMFLLGVLPSIHLALGMLC